METICPKAGKAEEEEELAWKLEFMHFYPSDTKWTSKETNAREGKTASSGGREEWPIKMIEMAGKTLERCLVNVDPFNGNQCSDKSCLPAKNTKKLYIM